MNVNVLSVQFTKNFYRDPEKSQWRTHKVCSVKFIDISVKSILLGYTRELYLTSYTKNSKNVLFFKQAYNF